MEIEVPAYAKVNLTLGVLGPFPEGHINHGFTRIDSIVSLLDLHDLVRVRVVADGQSRTEVHSDTLTVPQTKAGNVERNSAWKMVSVLRSEGILGRESISIEIVKRLPMGGGLGGSSTDAGAVLTALNSICTLGLSLESRIRVAAQVGSDCPLFASNFAVAHMTGRGEQLRECPTIKPPLGLVLLAGAEELFSGEVFSSLASAESGSISRESEPADQLIDALQSLSRDEYLPELLYNDLERAPIVATRMPELGTVKQALTDAGCFAAFLAGSGSTIVGLTDHASRAIAICEEHGWEMNSRRMIATQTRTEYLS